MRNLSPMTAVKLFPDFTLNQLITHTNQLVFLTGKGRF